MFLEHIRSFVQVEVWILKNKDKGYIIGSWQVTTQQVFPRVRAYTVQRFIKSYLSTYIDRLKRIDRNHKELIDDSIIKKR